MIHQHHELMLTNIGAIAEEVNVATGSEDQLVEKTSVEPEVYDPPVSDSKLSLLSYGDTLCALFF